MSGKSNIRAVESRRGKQLWAKTPHRDAAEFTDMRYTAVECPNPIEFDDWNYKMRCGENGRAVSLISNCLPWFQPLTSLCLPWSIFQIKVYIVITMYAEDDQELDSTLRGVAENLKNFPEYDDISVSWQEVAVAVVSDGRLKANKKTLEFASAMGVYDQELMYKYGNPGQKDWRATWDTYMHMFEFSAQFKEDDNFEKCYPPLQINFALKERNGGKLSSHLWFFNAFSNHLNPKYTFLLDVGTIARPRAICKLYQCFERDSQVAGVCGEIACFKPDYLNPVEASQHFEYKMSHILDKSTESIFGYISVLPGAFSAYRYEAIRPGEDGTGPLVDYFKSIQASMKDLGPFKANMYLAEDRILAYEIVARTDCNWILKYQKNAVAETDVPGSLHDLVKQRRRWLNGSFFAMLYAVLHFNRFWTRSSHSFGRKCFVSLQFITYVIQIILNWFLIGTFFLGFMMVIDSAMQVAVGDAKKFNATEKCDYRDAEAIVFAFSYAYTFLTLVQFICALGNKPEKMATLYSFCCLFYGIFNLFTMGVIALILADGNNASWQCNEVPSLAYCNAEGQCTGDAISVEQVKTAYEQVCTLAKKQSANILQCTAPADLLSEWECSCTASQVGQARFGDCQTLCADAPIPPTYLRWFTIGGISSYFVGAVLHGETFHILFSIVQYYYMLPTFINIFSIYSFCNVHDISWGTKGIEAAHGADTGGKAKKKAVGDDDEDRPRGETEQREADAKMVILQQQREKNKTDAIEKERGDVEAAFQSFRSYLVITWIASNILYVGVMDGLLNSKMPLGVAEPHYFFCTDAQAQEKAMVMGLGFKGGAFGVPADPNDAAIQIQFDGSSPACKAYGESTNMGGWGNLMNGGSTTYLRVPIKSAAELESDQVFGEACTSSRQPAQIKKSAMCCDSIAEIVSSTPATVSGSMVYLIMLFGLVIYTLGIKLVGCVLFLLFRRFEITFAKHSNKKRRNVEIRRQEMVQVDSPLGPQADGLSDTAIAAGWSAQVDPSTGRTYYQNTRTGQTDWSPPTEATL
jgi:chitin synthase